MANDRRYVFGAYTFDSRTGELRKAGLRVHVQEQPVRILTMLLNRPGEIVTREELREALWPKDTFVDYDNGLNTALSKLRSALGDRAETPRFIETLGRRGYRFIAPVSTVRPDDSGRSTTVSAEPVDAGSPGDHLLASHRVTGRVLTMSLGRAHRRALLTVAILLAALTVGLWLLRKAPSREDISSIVVLPFADLSRVPGDDYLAEALADALRTDLASVPGLKVTARPSSDGVALGSGRAVESDLARLAATLGVEAVVRGAFQHTGNRIRVNVQIIDATGQRLRWARSYERDASDLLALQRQMASDVAAYLDGS